MRKHMRAELTIAALIMAIQRQSPGALSARPAAPHSQQMKVRA
jgi:hypothetical protein